jgi:hypothetical protein
MRHGSTLIVVAGISALFLSLSLVFLSRMRTDAEESRQMQQEAQARIMLNAALHYIQETSRLGWDDPTTPEHEEAFGWLDIRDGRPGPRGADGRWLARDREGRDIVSAFPAPGYAARCPMHVWERPPFALSQAFTYNPAPRDPSMSWARLVSMERPDPMPAVTTWGDFARGDERIRRTSLDLAWFRVFRHQDDPATPQDERATFTITCGAGATAGFRDWAEVMAEGAGSQFGGDPAFFLDLRQQERLLFFRAEWTSAVGGSGSVAKEADSFRQVPVNGTAEGWWAVRGFVGSFLYIERLDQEPLGGAW